MLNASNASTSTGWLAFELGVLRRLKCGSVADPFVGEPELFTYLKRWGARVAVNDPRRWASERALARVENNTERLTSADVETVLEDAYVPRHRLDNPALRRWFNETDAWWFDNVRRNIARIESDAKRALAIDAGLCVGDYALSFDPSTAELRRPLSRVYAELVERQSAPVNNHHQNTAANKDAREFLSRERAELLFLRLPPPARGDARSSTWAWREEWVRVGDEFWDEFEAAREGRFGARVETRRQYLRHLLELLDAASHMRAWAIAHTENNFVSTEEVVETVRRLRSVGTVFTKDFSELTGERAVIITS